MSVNGTVTSLAAGDYEARVGAVGATLHGLTHRGRDLVLPTGPAVLGEGYRGRTLVPWPNRVVGGRYAVGGRVLDLPVNERATGAALHGYGAFAPWTVVGSSGAAATLELDLPATYGYPFDVVCRARYVLDDQGLIVTLSGTNEGRDPAPFGIGTHPYLTCGRPVDECTLVVPAGRVLLTDDRSTPTRLVPVDGDLDLRGPSVVGPRVVDNAFTDLPPGEWAVELSHPGVGGVRLSSDAPWVQVFTADPLGRRGAAVEPMTCPPDAFNSDPAGVLLAPGETRTLSLRVGAL
ncbi:aldose-1-epimerase [Ornithinimicrobium avium]|uniref:Aldose-1-epimerase n=1 Tax=Ornithinimicrobium avium TaxID=2283195 RepID=A0A345NK57_9MICO|nr:aldose-1-epimerase [Ornithinimicrobium avium]AXH95415.1 aldose-1-epimerase [Ornithinimicrobium avium]